MGAETAPKVPRPKIGSTKLILQSLPWNQARPPEVAHPVGEPDVDVDRQWRSLQSFDGSEIDRYSRAGDFLEEVVTEDEFWIPGWPSPVEARLEELESGVAGRDQAATALLGSEVLGVPPGESGGDEAGIGPIGKTDRATRVEPQGIASIDSLESICRRSAMGKGRQADGVLTNDRVRSGP